MNLAEYMQRVNLALGLGEVEYALSACEDILARFPSHLQARLLLGQALLEAGDLPGAAHALEQVLSADPENVMARSALALALERQGQLKGAIAELERAFEISPGNVQVREALLALRSQLERGKAGLELKFAAVGRVHARRSRHDQAVKAFDQQLYSTPGRLDVRLGRLESLWRAGRLDEAERECRELQADAPQSLKPRIVQALIMLQRGEVIPGTAMLHECCILDPSNSVAGPLTRGTGFVLPDVSASVIIQDERVPKAAPEIEDVLGTGANYAPEEPPEELPLLSQELHGRRDAAPEVKEFQSLISGLTERYERRARPEKASPRTKEGLYLILTNAGALRRKYGQKGYALVSSRLQRLRATLEGRGYEPRLVYVDDAEALRELRVDPVEGESPEEVAAFMDELRDRISSKGERLAHLLLVGNDDVVPMHRLPNPTDDDDAYLLSDGPYVSSASTPFVPGYSVARLPDDASGSPALLLRLIDALVSPPEPARTRTSGGLLGRLRSNGHTSASSLAYVAMVWKDATAAVFEQMRWAKDLRVSPPVTARSIEAGWLSGRQALLFNLHGAENSANWYGQKDASYPSDYPLFPVALTPDVLARADVTGAIVFTEACYGMNLVGRTATSSLALQLLQQGAACVVGSTRIAYGGSEPPLMGADLLAFGFWRHMAAGLTAGEALRRAKLDFVRDVQSRQGYLDGDDQKTVLSFVLVGDPSARLPVPAHLEAAKAYEGEPAYPAPSPVFCCTTAKAAPKARLGGDLMLRAREHLCRVAPESSDWELRILPRELCHEGWSKVCGGGT